MCDLAGRIEAAQELRAVAQPLHRLPELMPVLRREAVHRLSQLANLLGRAVQDAPRDMPTRRLEGAIGLGSQAVAPRVPDDPPAQLIRSEEHTSELQSRENL